MLPNPTQPFIVKPGAHVDVTVRFAPVSPGLKVGLLRIESNDPDEDEGTLDFDMAGQGGAPDIKVTGSTDFGDVCADTVAERTLSVCDVGTCTLIVGAPFFDPACGDFAIVSSPFPAPVSPDFCIDLVVRFTPTSAGSKSCQLHIPSDDPDQPDVVRVLTANTPFPLIDVPPDQGFPPTVIQSVGACESPEPFPISNNGKCNLTVSDVSITVNDEEYSLAGLPSLPTALEPGHVLGEGDLDVVFAPHLLARNRTGEVTVTYVSEPVTGDTTNVMRQLCGEGVRTGARVLVRAGGVPLLEVEKIHPEARLEQQQGSPGLGGRGAQPDPPDRARRASLHGLPVPPRVRRGLEPDPALAGLLPRHGDRDRGRQAKEQDRGVRRQHVHLQSQRDR